MRRIVQFIALGALVLGWCAPGSALGWERKVDFSRDVRPILSDNCFRCHGPDASSREADLRLDVLDAEIGPLALRDGYDIIVPGDIEESILMMRITDEDEDIRMPPAHSNKRLTPQQIEILSQWIEQGAPWGEHWAFVKPERPEVPEAKSWAKNPIDHFILARLGEQKIKPSPRADKVTLLRRLSLDLTGLPPTPAEMDAFLSDESPDAYEKQVERLLASPHYGERQARHWLDNARYADSNGYSHDFPRSIWPYRDWVIEALNADMPFDQFAVQQLAGDMLPDATTEEKVATGFHRNTQFNTEGGIDREQFRIEGIVDRVATTGTVLMGLTVACAQCHDHKFDPISQKEYYQLFAFFNNADEPTLKLTGITDPKVIEQLEQRAKQLDSAVKEKLETWEAQLTEQQIATLKPETQQALKVPPEMRNRRHRSLIEAALRGADNDFGAIVDDLGSVRNQLSEGVTTLVMSERAEPRETYVMINGDFTRPGERVKPGVPEVLPPLEVENPTRLDLARWIVDERNPLTARVTVNRIWQQYFGRGIVETENDFGVQGAQPTHPELLDWLATEFVSSGWSLKHMHRLIATSATYRQSSNVRPELENLDPYNRLYARQSRIRLDAEIVRDVALASSGLLSSKIGGPSVFPPIPDGVVGLGQVRHQWPTSKGADRFRRGMYTFTFRNSLHPALATFDAPDAVAACTRRIRSNTPLQALNLLNDSAWMEYAIGLAARTMREIATGDDVGRVDYAFRLVTSRMPSEDERQILIDLLEKKRRELADDPNNADAIVNSPEVPIEGLDKPELAAWTMVARTLLNLDETMTRE